MPFKTIKAQLLAISIIPIIALSLVLAISYSYMQVNYISKIHHDYGMTLVKNIGPSCEFGILTGNQEFLRSIAEKIIETSQTISVTIYDEDHNILLEAGSDEHRDMPKEWMRVDHKKNTEFFSTDSHTSFLAPIHSRPIDVYDDFQESIHLEDELDMVIGYIEITLSKQSTNKEISRVYSISFFITLIVILTFAAVASITCKRIANPIRELSSLIAKIKAGDLTSRSHIEATGEVHELQSGINEMSDALLHSHEKMQHEITKATQSFKEANQELEEKNLELSIAEKTALDASKAKSQFLANMSHEIRTPLNGIIGFTHLLQKTNVDQAQLEHIGIIQNSSNTLLSIINDILDFSKAESGNLTINNAPLDLYDTLDEVIKIVTPTAHEKDLTINYIIYDDVSPNIISDEHKIRHILLNLISNAIKFTQQGAIEIRVSLEEDEENEEAQEQFVISVTDSGIGIKPKDQAHIFQPFQQADASTTRNYGGTGLGLPISKHFAEMLGGSITIDSTPGEGATFHVSLPYLQDENAPEQAVEKLLPNTSLLIHTHNALARFKLSHLTRALGALVDHDEHLDLTPNNGQQKNYEMIIIDCNRREIVSGETPLLLRTIEEAQPDCKILLIANTCDPEILSSIPTQPNLWTISQPFTHTAFFNALKYLTREEITPTPTSVIEHASTTQNLEKHHILIVEDNAINSKLLTALLDQFKIASQLAESGKHAVEMCKTMHYDLIFMDLHMPEMDGTTAMQLIKQANSSLPIIATTADILANHDNALLQDGFDGIITKPIDENKLIECLSHWLSKNSNTLYNTLIKQFNGKESLAQEMYTMLIKELQEKRPQLLQLWDAQQMDALTQLTHKINGSASYCGLLDLREAAQALETSLKAALAEKIPDQFQNFIHEIDNILQQHADDQLDSTSSRDLS